MVLNQEQFHTPTQDVWQYLATFGVVTSDGDATGI